MNPEIVLNIVQQALQVTLLVAAPLLLTALGTGLLVSVFQAATQINEMTLSFIPKLVAIFAVAVLAACFVWVFPWLAPYMPFNDTTVGEG